jgi:hypothetical protein
MKRVSYVGRKHSLAKILVRGVGSFGVYWAAFTYVGPIALFVALIAGVAGIEFLAQRNAADGRFISAFEREPGKWRVYYGTTDAARSLAKSMVMDDVSEDMATVFRIKRETKTEV